MDSKRFSTGLKRARSSLSSFVGFARRAVLGIGVAAGAALVPVIKIASDLEETMNKFNVVFGDNADSVKMWGDQFAGTVGRSQKQIADFLASSQDLFVPLGFEPGAAENMSKAITALSVDLASFNNMNDADTLRDLQAALTGSSEVMKKYGVIVNETAVKQRALSMGFDPKNLTEQQKVLARLNIIMEGTTAAQGDAIRSSGSFANQMKALKASVMDTAASLGSVLLPMATKFITDLNTGIKVLAFSAQNFGLVWDVIAEAASNGFITMVARAEWFGGVIMDVLGFIGRNWKDIFRDFFNFTLTVFQNLGDNIIEIFKAAFKSITSLGKEGFEPVLKTLTEGFQSSLSESLELREFKPPTLSSSALNKYKDELAKELDIGKTLSDQFDLSKGMGGITDTLGGSGGEGTGSEASKKVSKPQGPSEAIALGSAEGIEKIVMAMTGRKNRPEDKTAKNTSQTVLEIQGLRRDLRAKSDVMIAGATP